MRITVPEPIIEICRTLTNAGFEAVTVGGAVRDSLMGRTPHDWDLATSATPSQVASVFGRYRMRSNNGEDHGTVLVLDVNGNPCEVTTFRRDVACDGRRATTAFTTNLMEDLERRDLTINAIAFNPITGEFTHPEHSLEDVQNRIVRFVGDGLNRIREDRLRVLRAIRITIQINGLMAMETVDAIFQAMGNGLLPGPLSAERVRDELLKTLVLPRADDGMRLWHWFGLMDIFLPEVSALFGLEQGGLHTDDAGTHTLNVINASSATSGVDLTTLRLTALLHDIGKPATRQPVNGIRFSFIGHEDVGAEMARAVCQRLRIENDMTASVVFGVANHMTVPGVFATVNPRWIRRWARAMGSYVDFMLDLSLADRSSIGGLVREEVTQTIDEIRSILVTTPVVHVQSMVNGSDVMRITGERPGPRIGYILEAVAAYIDEIPSVNREEVLDFIAQFRS